MTNRVHMLEIYDLDNYAGPNPVRLEGQFVVHGPEGSQYYILKLNDAMQLEDRCINCIAVRPHYDGDPIANVMESICTVGIALPCNGTDYQEGITYGFSDFNFWKVGKIKPPH